MNVPAVLGAVFGTAITGLATEDPKATLLGAATGLITVGILDSVKKENEDQDGDFLTNLSPRDFCTTACASLWPSLVYEKEELYQPRILDDDELWTEDDILDLPITIQS
ncbi:hypothetical protein FDJ25_gp129 [Vibrio phage Aphrodite1]|uniref:Uncharacterized protein n=1 Tax=Vibrio phage Aphrodite1 TaxID=2070057 RepID=A0A2I7QI70_9CAUD|nr:hypothetical protein FDJ25_gp129 [Vibrio phage Aphrodite1]AUR81087.1 hypothetical protein Aphrodite1_0072 [Vibrio phage Aphrodite1]